MKVAMHALEYQNIEFDFMLFLNSIRQCKLEAHATLWVMPDHISISTCLSAKKTWELTVSVRTQEHSCLLTCEQVKMVQTLMTKYSFHA